MGRSMEKEQPHGTQYGSCRDNSSRLSAGKARSRDRSKDNYRTNHMPAYFGDKSLEEEAEWNTQMYELEQVGFGPSTPDSEQALKPGKNFQPGPVEEESAAAKPSHPEPHADEHTWGQKAGN